MRDKLSIFVAAQSRDRLPLTSGTICPILRCMNTFAEMMKLWPGGYRQMADDIGVKHETARKWGQRNRIPPEYWADVLASARLHRIAISSDLMVRIAGESRDVAA